jgi:dihydroxyacetone kinase
MKHIAHHFVLLLEGFVGAGMLSAAVAGSVFTSPPARNVLHAIHCIAEGNEGKNIICNIIFKVISD